MTPSTEDISVGFDLGGTNIRAAVFRGLELSKRCQTKAIEPVAILREEIGSLRTPEAIVKRVAILIRRLLEMSELGALSIPVGIGFAGMLRGHDGMVANSPNYGWHDIALGNMLRAKLGERYHLGIYNDVNAICYGEYAFGAGAGSDNVLTVFVGTGIGSGAICSGRLLEGSNNTATELGHTKVVLDSNARICACGLKGCVEAYVGGRQLQSRARYELSRGARSEATRLAGCAERVNPGHLDAAAAMGDNYALDLYTEVAPLLGLVMANAVTLLNPDRLILGGGMLSRTPVLLEHVLAAFEVAVNPPAHEKLEIVEAQLGDRAGLLGSALLAAQQRRSS
jgi:glucokinase